MASGVKLSDLLAITSVARSRQVPVTHQNRCFSWKRKIGNCGSFGDDSGLVCAIFNAEFLP
jgi:hypothetical protein